MHSACCTPSAGPSTPEAALGATDTFIESTHAIFNDTTPATNYDFIDFKTATPLNLSSYNLYLANDGNPYRAATSFALLGGNTAGTITTVIDLGSLNPDYVAAYGGSNEIVISNAALPATGFQYFEIRLQRAVPNGGPRLIELDGFGRPTPEPSTLVLAVFGSIGGLLAARRGRRRA